MARLRIKDLLNDDVDQVKAKLGVDSYTWGEHSEKLKEALDGINREVAKKAAEDGSTIDTLAEAIKDITQLNGGLFEGTGITKADFPSVTHLGSAAFSNCVGLTDVNFPAVTTAGDGAFYNCKSLKSVDLPSLTEAGPGFFQKSGIESVKCEKIKAAPEGFCYGCTSLTEVNLPAATTIGQCAFSGCTSLTEVNLPAATTIGEETFYNCTSLTEVNLPLVTSISYGDIKGSENLTSLTFPSVTDAGVYSISGCDKLATIDFPALQSWNRALGPGLPSLTALILRKADDVCVKEDLGSVGSSDCPLNPAYTHELSGYIYVPSALVDSYKTATNWVPYAAKFRALEDYTVDGTTTGALDSSKI